MVLYINKENNTNKAEELDLAVHRKTTFDGIHAEPAIMVD
jgi:hypothetical protein